ncbi:MAG: hypothetical protein JWO60_3136 [Frankiales bacterium]|jgi:hypothetical protein|nr:hypothetical protein [Frankiales bacterium]
MSLFRTSRSTRPGTAVKGSRTRRALARALAAAPTQESRHELVALSTRL